MILLDADVLIECLRGKPSALEWLRAAPDREFAVPGIVAMELMAGCRNRSGQDQIQKFAGRFPVLWPEAVEFALAFDLLIAHRLGSGLGIPDCLIAAMALRRNFSLYSFNLEHFAKIPELEVREPYTRV